MKKTVLILVVIFCSMTILSAKDSAPADIAKVKSKLSEIMLRYYQSVVKANSAKEFAAAIDRYTSDLSKLAPELKTIETKYGRQGQDVETVEYDYDDFNRECDDIINDEKYAQAFQKHAKYFSDPAVQAAMNRMVKVMQQFDTEEDEE